jgi:hypothetical protein
MTFLFNRFPKREEVLPVFGSVVFVVFSWSIRGFLYIVPSLILRHSVGETLSVLCYMLAFSLLESLLLISGVVLVSIFLPRKWFLEGFAYKGFIALLVFTVALIVLQNNLTNVLPPVNLLYLGFAITMGVMVALLFLSDKVTVFRKALLAIAERLQVFVYIYVPLGILGMVVVIFRNL